jgi:hypothetical protein
VEWLRILLGILCVWRVTHLLNAEDGLGGGVAWVRRAAGTALLGRVLGCFYCLSLYVSAPLALLLAERWEDRLLLWPALSAGAILLERVTGAARLHLRDFYAEDAAGDQVQEDGHVLR